MSRLILLTLIGASCQSYDCAELTLFEDSFGEQCGPGGSQGNLYFEDGMAMLIIGAAIEEFLTEESSTIYDYVPTVVIGFRSVHLDTGTSLDEGQTVVTCGRSQGLGTGYSTYPGLATIEVIEPSKRTQTGGQSWVFAWEATCLGGAEITASGEDVIELAVSEFGYEWGLYGKPADWPEP